MILFKKMYRDIRHSMLSYIACAIIIMIGLMTYTSMMMARDNLISARDEFYTEQNFADGYIKLTGAPSNIVDRVSKIKGISHAEGRIIKDVRVIFENEKRNVSLRLVSGINDGTINKTKILEGRLPLQGEPSAVIGTKFYKARRLHPGSVLIIASEGRKIELNVSGSGQSPEFVFAIKNNLDMLPDPETFEIAYVDKALAEQITGMQGKINDIVFKMDGSRDYKDIEREIKDDLRAYGIENVFAKKDQPSNSMLNEEFKQLEKSSQTIPVIFLMVAAIILYIMLKRLVEQQRGQIGIMKAFGYRYSAILSHYASYGIVTGVLGGILGGIAGIWLSFVYTDLYKVYYSFPNLKASVSFGYFIGSIIVSTFFCIIAAYIGAKNVLRLSPTEAMHPPTPSFGKKTFFESIPGFNKIFTLQGNMAVRNLFRNYKRTLLVLLGIVFTFALMSSMLSISSLFTDILMDHFTKVQQYDIKVVFSRPSDSLDASSEMKSQNGVMKVESLFEMPAQLTRMNYKKDTIIIGLDSSSQLYKIYDTKGNITPVPDDGIMLSKHIAESLNADVGSTIVINSPYANDADIKLRVSCIINQNIGSNAYMSKKALGKITGSSHVSTSLMVLADKNAISEIKDKYATAKNVSLIEERQETIDKYNKMMATSAGSIWIMALISVFTVFAVIYTSSMISLEERRREISLLRLIGMKLSEVMEIITVEQWIIGIIGIILGIPMGYMFNAGIVKGLSSDLYSIPTQMGMEALFQSAMGVALAILMSNIWLRRSVKKINMIESLSAGVRE